MRLFGFAAAAAAVAPAGCATSDDGDGARPPVLTHGGQASATGKADDAVGFWWIGVTVDPATALVNTGARTTFEVANKPPPVGCIDSWTAETVSNGLWAQVGYSSCNVDDQAVFNAFYQVWSANDQLSYGETTVTNGMHSFAMQVDHDTTWAFSIDAQPFGTFDMGTATAPGTWSQTVTEEGNGVPAPYTQAATSFPEAISLLHDGVWTRPQSGLVYDSAGVAGVSGEMQNGKLAAGAMTIGKGTKLLPSSTVMWNAPAAPTTYHPKTGGPKVPNITVSAPLAGTTIRGTVTLTATATKQDEVSTVQMWSATALLCTVTTAPFTCTWDTTTSPDGANNVSAAATDAAGRTTWSSNNLTIDNAAP